MSGTLKTDVLIAGAGPAGMTLGVALHRRGIRFRIVDRDNGPADATRAPVLWQRTQEILSAPGIRDRWQPVSDEMREESLHLYGKAAGELSALAPNSPFPKAIFNGQNVTERILDTYLSEVMPSSASHENTIFPRVCCCSCVPMLPWSGLERSPTNIWTPT